MAKKAESRPAAGPAKPRRLAAPKKGRRIASALARSTLLAAGFAVAQLATPELDSRFQMFDRTLVDRLHAPITRHHE
jgi:hypothetical protein